MKHYRYFIGGIALFIVIMYSCKKESIIIGGSGLDDWTAETHGYGATPNYTVVFNQNEVHRLDFVIEAEYWEAMQNDLESIISTSAGAYQAPTPMYIPAQMFYEDKQWYDVGIRYKGNSSLNTAYSQGVKKFPFRIEMNHFENENPNINGQTFYGFTQLSLSSGFKDDSYMHEKVAADIFREFGVPSAQTAFYRIYIDHGNGPVYFGLYTLVEVVFDTPMLNAQFGNSSGNCYKPDGPGSRMNAVSLLNSEFFPNKTNEGAGLEDIDQLVATLLSETRTSNPSQWRNDMEQILDMEVYLKYLAANTTIKNWDTYGRMWHNFYLYNDPSSGKLVWIPWDNNETFTDGPGGPGAMTALAFDFSDLSTTPPGPDGHDTWPLISYVYSDVVYKDQYDDYIDEFITTVFTVSNLTDKFTTFHNMIQPYVNGAHGEIVGYTNLSSPVNFDNSLSDLINYISARVVEADNYTP